MEKEDCLSDLLIIGKIVGVHGLKGTLKVFSYADSISTFNSGNEICIKHSDGFTKNYVVKWSKSHKSRKKEILLLYFNDINLDAAEKLVGNSIYIKKSELPELEDGIFYWHDLIGLNVFNVNNKYIGCIESIISTGSNDVYVTKDNNKRETLIPALKSVIVSIDINNKSMVVDLPEGLYI